MKSRKGAFRLWAIGSLAWVAWVVWASDLACPLALLHIETPDHQWCKFENAEPLIYYAGLAIRAAGPPLVAGVSILAAFWVAAGFRGGPDSN